MAFSVAGRISEDGPVRAITWNNGTITGDVSLVKMVNAMAVNNEGRYLGLPTSAGHNKDHISHGESVMVICNTLLIDPVYDGDTAFVEPVEEGAVA